MSLYHFLPKEIIYDCIIPLIPVYGITKKDLKLQKKRIKLVSYMKELLLIDDIKNIKNDILQHYQGDLDYCFEDSNTYLYINLRIKNDYIYIIN